MQQTHNGEGQRSVLDVTVSYFANAKTTTPDTIQLVNWLVGIHSAVFLVQQIRASTDKFQRDQFKKQLPAITPSGTFTKRNKSALIAHSGLIAFDIDNIGDSADDIRSALSRIPNIAYCGLSASGAGLWGLIPISTPARHEAHFRAIELAFLAMGITIDPSCKDVSRLRFYSYDTEAYFNHNAVVFDQVYYDPPPPTVAFRGSSGGIIERACKIILNAADGGRHFARNKAAFLLGGYVGAGKVDETEARIALQNAVTRRGAKDMEQAFRTINDGLKAGQSRPING